MTISKSIVVAAADNDVIGNDGKMPWHLTTDLKRFKKLTFGKPVIMGRKTFEAIGKALPGRTSVVVTRNREWQAQGAVPVLSFDAALATATELAKAGDVDEICIIGGGEIYRQALERADVLYVTRVHDSPEGDTTFPEINRREWREISCEEVSAGEKDSAASKFIVYHRVV